VVAHPINSSGERGVFALVNKKKDSSVLGKNKENEKLVSVVEHLQNALVECKIA
jgi:hypothetical protein